MGEHAARAGNSGPLVLVLDREGRILLWNAACEAATGFTFDEVVGRTALDVLGISGADGGTTLDRLGGDGWFVTKGGNHKRVRWTLERVRDTSGPARWLLNAVDWADAAYLAGVVEISADAIVALDEEQRIVFFNEGAEHTFGWSRDEVLGQLLDVLIPERFRAIHREHVRRFATEPVRARRMGERKAEIMGLRRTGEEFAAAAAISKLKVAGRWLFTVELRDVSEQKRTEQEQAFLAEVGAVLASTLDYEATLDRIAQLAVQRVADGCVLILFDEEGVLRLRKFVDRDPSHAVETEALSQHVVDPSKPDVVWTAISTRRPVVLPEIPPGYFEAIAQDEEHLRAIRGLGPRTSVAVPLLAHGKVLGAMVLYSSQPQRRFGANEVRLAEELAYRAALAIENAGLYRSAHAAIQARDELLGVVAHDLRNPLQAARLATVGLLREAEVTDKTGAVRDRAEVVHRCLDRCDRLIEELLDVARIESGRLGLALAPIAPVELVRDSVEAVSASAEEASLTLAVDLEPGLPPVLVDRDRVLRVFSNLLGNALKFTPGGGRVWVRAERQARDVLFEVGDTGPGLTAEQMPHLFDRFWQAQRADRRGLGLGLPIAKGIVEEHGGRMWAESAPGKGSRLFFTLPIAR